MQKLADFTLSGKLSKKAPRSSAAQAAADQAAADKAAADAAEPPAKQFKPPSWLLSPRMTPTPRASGGRHGAFFPDDAPEADAEAGAIQEYSDSATGDNYYFDSNNGEYWRSKKAIQRTRLKTQAIAALRGSSVARREEETTEAPEALRSQPKEQVYDHAAGATAMTKATE